MLLVDPVFDPPASNAEDAPCNELAPGMEVAGFRILDQIGEGSMAAIFRAVHMAHGHTVALKALAPEYCSRPEAVRRFAREIQVVRRARHPNVLEISDLVHGGDHPPLLVMELLSGEDLAALVARKGAVPPRMALEVFVQVCDALAAMHSRSVVHRDLKPGNIFLVGGGDDPMPIVKVLDFGLAKFMYEEDPFLHTRTGCAVGTPEYMPPEQIRGLKVDERIDIYAVGAILYELLTGHPPFYGGSVFDLVEKALNDPVAPPSSELPWDRKGEVPPLLDDIVLRCLEKDPERRIQSAAELRGWLIACRDEQPVTLPPLARPRPAWHWALAGLAAAALALVLVLVAWLLLR